MAGSRGSNVNFKIWDRHFAGYMLRPDGSVACFASKVDCDHAIQRFIRTRDRQDEWLSRLDVHHLDTNIAFHLSGRHEGDKLLHYIPEIRPVDFRVPKSHWKLLALDGSVLTPGAMVRTFRKELVELIELAPPPARYEGLVTCLENDHKCWWVPQVIGGEFKYLPPESDSNRVGLMWAAQSRVHFSELMDVDTAFAMELKMPARRGLEHS